MVNCYSFVCFKITIKFIKRSSFNKFMHFTLLTKFQLIIAFVIERGARIQLQGTHDVTSKK